MLIAWIHVPPEGLLSAKSANLIVLSARLTFTGHEALLHISGKPGGVLGQ
jgi:hypothetical protein